MIHFESAHAVLRLQQAVYALTLAFVVIVVDRSNPRELTRGESQQKGCHQYDDAGKAH